MNELALFAQEEFTWRDFADYGLPALLLVALLFALWKITVRIQTKIIEPAIAAHLELMAALTKNMPLQTVQLETQTETLDEIKEMAKTAAKKTDEVSLAAAAQNKLLVDAINRSCRHTA